MEVLPTENQGTLCSSPVDTSDKVKLGFLTAVTINLSFFRNMMQYSVVLSAALKDDTGQLLISEARVQSQESSFETCGGKSSNGSVLAESTSSVPCHLSYHQSLIFVPIVQQRTY
jgi:hypothetical protein